jgi:CTP:molybdopterin cytidylyltransferase MocA
VEIAGLALAAGAGSRFGLPKALVQYQGSLLVERAAQTLTAAGCARTVVVIGAEADLVRAAAPGLEFVENPEWASGMASSLRAGLAALRDGGAGAVVVLLVDMPGVTPDSVRRVSAGATPATLAIGGYAEGRGHPVLLGRDHWDGVAATATGDVGARDYLRAHEDLLRVVPVDDVADDFDLDTPEQAAMRDVFDDLQPGGTAACGNGSGAAG